MTSHKVIIPNSLVLGIDIALVVFSVFAAYLLRFNFSVPASELEPLPGILGFMVLVRILFFLVSRSYTGPMQYITILDILKLYLYTILGSMVFLATNVVTYYLVNKTLFIPLTIVILEFLITSFLLFAFRGAIMVSIRWKIKN